jgi:hypothetical protein
MLSVEELVDRLIDLSFAEDIGDGDHTTKKFTHNNELGRVRYDCFVFENGLQKPTAIIAKAKNEAKKDTTEAVEETTPVSTYEVDDEAAIQAIFREKDNE